jgi:Tol biopolymer transport system component
VTLSPGARLGPYEIVAPLGAGGMGEVYRARDTRLGREVAVKVLPGELAHDADRLRRFEQEARAVSALNHPNVLTLHEFGAENGVAYFVTELLAGRALRDLLAAGERIPVRRALDWGVQAARGLAAAHEKGIVHRDLKPENLFLTSDGTLKILDFGLAKLTTPDEGALAAAATIAGTDTASGVVLGTAGYMAPEQVRGERVDARADLFALGCVLYELLSGRRAFQGESGIDTLHAILRDEPAPLAELRAEVPPAVARVVDSCLAKSAAQRFQSAKDLALALDVVGATSGVSTSVATALRAPAARTPDRTRWALPAATAALALAGGLAVGRLTFRAEPPPPSRVRTLTYSGRDSAPAISPDGRTIAFSSDRDGRSRIWIKQLKSGAEAPITAGVDRAPRFFPDGESLLVVHAEAGKSSLHRVALLGGASRKLIDDAGLGDVSPDGRRIAFIRTVTTPEKIESVLFVARVDGGDERELLRVHEFALVAPRFSPDGRTIAVAQSGQAGAQGMFYLVPTDGGAPRPVESLLPNAVTSAVAWASDGHGFYYIQAHSSVAGVTSSEGLLIFHDLAEERARQLLWTPVTATTIAFAGRGPIVFDGPLPHESLRAISLDRTTGAAQPELGHWLTRGFVIDRQPVVTPDGERVIFSSGRNGNLDLWSLSLASGAATPLTDDPADDWDPGFTADGKLLWSSNRSGSFEIWIAAADGSGARQVTRDGDAENPTATPDGAWIVYASGAAKNAGIWKIRPDGTDATRLATGLLLNPELSPDGAYVAYRTSFSTGTSQLLVRVVRTADGATVPFEIVAPDNGNGHAARARWLPDGRAIAFVGADEEGVQGIFAQDFVPGADTSATRRKLGGFDPERLAESFGISRDGRRLIVAAFEQTSNLMAAEHVPGVESGEREPR